LHLRAVSAGGALLFGVWDRAAQRPMDFAALLTAATLSIIVVVNAVFLQTGSRSPSYFVPPAAPTSVGNIAAANSAPLGATAAARPAEPGGATPRLIAPGVITPQPQPVAVRRDDPIADLIAPSPSPRVAAVQRALSDYGYGQIKPSGVVDDSTSAAIQKFERDHKMPVTGRVSDRLIGELSTLVGHPLN
jgi:hypothetical protein